MRYLGVCFLIIILITSHASKGNQATEIEDNDTVYSKILLSNKAIIHSITNFNTIEITTGGLVVSPPLSVCASSLDLLPSDRRSTSVSSVSVNRYNAAVRDLNSSSGGIYYLCSFHDEISKLNEAISIVHNLESVDQNASQTEYLSWIDSTIHEYMVATDLLKSNLIQKDSSKLSIYMYKTRLLYLEYSAAQIEGLSLLKRVVLNQDVDAYARASVILPFSSSNFKMKKSVLSPPMDEVDINRKVNLMRINRIYEIQESLIST